jgi:hypothetical protein
MIAIRKPILAPRLPSPSMLMHRTELSFGYSSESAIPCMVLAHRTATKDVRLIPALAVMTILGIERRVLTWKAEDEQTHSH